MIMRRIYLLCWVIGLGLAGCVEDKTNTHFTALNEISISGLEESYIRNIGDSLVITPTLEHSLDMEDEELEYLWFFSTSRTVYAADTLSRERDLRVAVRTVPGEYNLTYKITDPRTGIFSSCQVPVRVDGAYSKGVLVLAENEGFAQLSFLPEKGNFVTGVYEGANQEKLGRNPRKVFCLETRRAEYKEVFVLCHDDRGGVCLNTNNMLKRTTIREAFFVPLEEPEIKSDMYFKPKSSTFADYLLIGGKAYNRSINMANEPRFKAALISDKQGYEADAWHFSGASTAWFFDRKNRRFLAHKDANMGSLVPFLAGDAGNFDPNNVGLDVVCGGFGKGGRPNSLFGLFKEPGDEGTHYMMIINLDVQTYKMDLKEKYPVDDAEHLLSASCYEIPRFDYYQYLIFYAFESRVYVFNAETRVTEMLYDFNEEMEGDFHIDCLEVASKSDLRVGLRNKNLTGKQGGFVFLKLTELGGLGIDRTVAPVTQFGFCDKVVDFDIKQ